MKARAQLGFTLIEIVVAMLVAAILAVMAFTTMREALNNRDRIAARSARLQALQFTMRSFAQDFSQLEPRPVREALGAGYQPAVVGTEGESSQVQFTRSGWMNPAGVSRSTLQRVRYELRDGTLYRDYWLVLDAQLEPVPASRPLLDGVRSFRIRYMNDGKAWQQFWPPPPQGSARTERELRWRPVAVELTLELEDWGRVTRLIEVAG